VLYGNRVLCLFHNSPDEKNVILVYKQKETGTVSMSISMTKRINIFLVVLFFFLSILAFSFHHHEDDLSHDNCPLCFLGLHKTTFINQNHFDIYPHFDATDRVFIESYYSLHLNDIQSFLSRAPPA
jgi:hypothetical protein